MDNTAINTILNVVLEKSGYMWPKMVQYHVTEAIMGIVLGSVLIVFAGIVNFLIWKNFGKIVDLDWEVPVAMVWLMLTIASIVALCVVPSDIIAILNPEAHTLNSIISSATHHHR